MDESRGYSSPWGETSWSAYGRSDWRSTGADRRAEEERLQEDHRDALIAGIEGLLYNLKTDLEAQAEEKQERIMMKQQKRLEQSLLREAQRPRTAPSLGGSRTLLGQESRTSLLSSVSSIMPPTTPRAVSLRKVPLATMENKFKQLESR